MSRCRDFTPPLNNRNVKAQRLHDLPDAGHRKWSGFEQLVRLKGRAIVDIDL